MVLGQPKPTSRTSTHQHSPGAGDTRQKPSAAALARSEAILDESSTARDHRPSSRGCSIVCFDCCANLECTRGWNSPPSGASQAATCSRCPAKLHRSELRLRLTRRRIPRRHRLREPPTKQPRGHSARHRRRDPTQHRRAGSTSRRRSAVRITLVVTRWSSRCARRRQSRHHRSRERPRGGCHSGRCRPHVGPGHLPTATTPEDAASHLQQGNR